MAKKAKRFRIGVEGATTDGRTIERSWLEQMAANYSPELYTAVINMEHIKGSRNIQIAADCRSARAARIT